MIGNHRAADCPSKTNCQICNKRRHTSICDSTNSREKALTTNQQASDGVFPVLVIKVNGVKCRALIDSGSGSSYISAKLANILKAKSVENQMKQVEMLMYSKRMRMGTYKLDVESLDGKHEMKVKFIKVDKGELLSINNPRYAELIRDNSHLSKVIIADKDKKSQLLLHVILGRGEHARIKTEAKPLIGNDGEPVAEFTKMGWFVMSPGVEFDQNTMLLTQTSHGDYEKLCRLGVLGLEDRPENDQSTVHTEFKEQLLRAEEGWYETGLPWQGNHPKLPDNTQGSLQRLDNLTRRLQRKGLTAAYDEVIQDQLKENNRRSSTS